MAKQDLVAKYREEYNSWLQKLQPYHTQRFNRNYEQYTAHTAIQGTKSKISDPVAPELVERVIQKLYERDPKFFVLSKGQDIPREITNVMSGIIEYFWTNPDIIHSTGTMRGKLKVAGREFCIIGQTCVEAYFNSQADLPDMKVIPMEDIIFNPSKTPKTSEVLYVRSYVDVKYLEDNKEITKGGKVLKGIFDPKSVDRIKGIIKEDKIKDDDKSSVNRSGSTYAKSVGAICLVSRWDKDGNCCRFIGDQRFDETPMLQEFTSILGEHPYAIAMDIEVPKEPYAFSILDFLNGLTKAKDMILNQVVDYGAKALNPPVFVDPSVASNPVSRASLKNMNRLGGIAFINPQLIKNAEMPQLPSIGMSMLTYIQQRAESTSGIGAYLGGVPNQESDTTQGTKGGIQSLIEQAISPVKDRQTALEESIIEPIVNKWLKFSAKLMSLNETKYAMITGEDSKWVKMTKGLLAGKATLQDLFDAGVMELEEATMSAALLESQGLDPKNHKVIDADWVVRVEAGSLAETDTEKELRDFDSAIEQGMNMGVPIDAKKVWKERAIRAGIKEPEQYLISEEEQMQQPQEQDPFNQGMQGQPQPQPLPGQAIPQNKPMGA